MQHHKKLKDLKLKDLGVDKNAEEDIDPNTAFNLLTVAGTGNAAILDDLLKAKWDPDIGDSQGRTALVSIPYISIVNIIFDQFTYRIPILCV